MRFLVIVKATKDSEAGIYSRAAIEEMGKFNEGLVKDGIVLAMDGLHPSSKGTRLRFDGGRTTVTDGPFAETKELVAGFWIVQGKSRAEVVERFTHAPFDGGNEIEIRELFELEDFDEEVAAGIRERRKCAGFEPAFQEN
ncbi:MAG TPA: YciI family protein [Candidatus Acidoferrales bacterium]|nr:YciI family protein [Candidatus Acidoferrales bacterium]